MPQERARLPSPHAQGPRVAPGGQSPGQGGAGLRGDTGTLQTPAQVGSYRVSVPGAGPGLPGDGYPGDAAGGSRSGGRARASGRRRAARGGPEGRPAAPSGRAGLRRRGAAPGGRGRRRAGRGRAGPGWRRRGHRPQILTVPAGRSVGGLAERTPLQVLGPPPLPRGGLGPGPGSRERNPRPRGPGWRAHSGLAPLPPRDQRIESAFLKVSKGCSSAKPLSAPRFPGCHQKGRSIGPGSQTGLWAHTRCAVCSLAAGPSFPSGLPLHVEFGK